MFSSCRFPALPLVLGLWKEMVRPALLRPLQQMLSPCYKERNKARTIEINHKSHFLTDSVATRAWQTEWSSMCSFIEAVMLWLSSLSCHHSWGSHTIFRSQRTRNLLVLCNWSAGDLELMGEVHCAPHHPQDTFCWKAVTNSCIFDLLVGCFLPVLSSLLQHFVKGIPVCSGPSHAFKDSVAVLT